MRQIVGGVVFPLPDGGESQSVAEGFVMAPGHVHGEGQGTAPAIRAMLDSLGFRGAAEGQDSDAGKGRDGGEYDDGKRAFGGMPGKEREDRKGSRSESSDGIERVGWIG